MRDVKLSEVEAEVEANRRDEHYKYRTSSELAFIRGLVSPAKAKPVEALKAYRKALEKRAVWTGIDRDYVFKYIDTLLARAGSR
jgi:hypothetical protein